MQGKRLVSIAAAVMGAALILAGCSTPATTGPSTGAPNSPVLSFGKPDGPQSNNSNPFVTTSAARDLGYAYAIYEPLVIDNVLDPTSAPTPWLATAWKWNDDYTAITFTIRTGVKWSDGQDLTADDVAYSIQMRMANNGALNNEALPYKDVATNGNDVTISFTMPQYVNQHKIFGLFVVPKHIWSTIADPTTELNQNPVGSGPYVLDTFTPTAVTLKANPSYWGGAPAVDQIQYQSFNDNTALLNALVAGQVQWGWGYIANYQTVFDDKDPAYVSWFPSPLNFDALWFNCSRAPFNDVKLRQAVSMIIDRQVLSTTGSTGAAAPITSVTGLPMQAGSSYIASQYQGKTFSVDVQGAQDLLTQAGYKVDPGKSLTDPNGKAVSITMAVPSGWNDYQAELQLIADAMTTDLGIQVDVQAPTSDTWFADVGNGNFDATLHWTDQGMTPYDAYSSIMNGSYLKAVGDTATNNFGRFDSKDATNALNAYANATNDADRATAMATIQDVFVNQVPAVPLLERPSWGQYSTKYYAGWPSAQDPYNDINMTLPCATLILTKLHPAG